MDSLLASLTILNGIEESISCHRITLLCHKSQPKFKKLRVSLPSSSLLTLAMLSQGNYKPFRFH